MGPHELVDFAIDETPITGDTRERLLEAGLRLFAAKGFDSVSTRELTRAADVNIAAIGYHFGGKQELYHAVIEQQVKETEPLVAPIAAQLRASLDEAAGDPEKLSKVATRLVEGLLQAFTGSERMRIRAALIMREYAMPSSGFGIIFHGRIEPLHKGITELVSVVLDRSPDDPQTVVRAHAVIGQIIIFFLARIILFARLGWSSYGPGEMQMVCQEVTESVLLSLGLPILPAAGD
ncbi:MAG: CerR family C-terminal domain-containing protein [Rhodospirillales bacterium]|nr:CerR family C-terminal domain-containing protein [Rhodospirillales bacterium]